LTLFKHITHEFEDEQFDTRSKDGDKKAFSRVKFFTIKKLVVVIMLLKSSYQAELDRFCKSLLEEDYDIRQVTKGALTQARAKLNPWVFQRLMQIAVDSFYTNSEYAGWRGHRVLAVDGSRLKLPNSKDIIKEFGVHHVGRHASCPVSMATASVVYDVFNHITIDAHIGPWSKSESEFVFEDHMEVFKAGDCVLADRGYPSMKLMVQLKERKVEFCFRMKENWWKPVREFRNSTKRQLVIHLPISKKVRKELGLKLECNELKVRLMKIDLGDGAIEILCTSLTDSRRYPHKEFKELYHMRWGIEEAYKLLKNRIEVENFSGLTARSIYQDFHAKVFMMTLCSIMSYPIDEKVKAEYAKEKTKNVHDQQINKTHALAVTKDNLIQLFFKDVWKKTLGAMDKLIENTREIIRPQRNEPRKHKPKKPHHINYKPT
ncbi:MAG: IS4 family transposase, partial [Saprospiraceae bacterium]